SADLSPVQFNVKKSLEIRPKPSCTSTRQLHIFVAYRFNHPSLVNDNSVGCRQIAVCGGLETLCGLIAGHYPSFSSYLPNFSDQAGELIVLEGHNKCLNDQELDFLIAILVLLVNLVEKDSRNRTTRIPIVREKNDCDAYSELLLGISWFDCSADARSTSFPSLSFVNTEKETHPLWLPGGTSFYGTGDFSGQFEELGKGYFLLTDAWGYWTGTTSLYQSHPWVLTILPNGEALGILANTTKRCEIDLRKDSTVKLTAPSPFPVITFGPFASAIEVLESLSHELFFYATILDTGIS
ncbi:alpha-glucosidase 2, partial [Tanacetum coccineum]